MKPPETSSAFMRVWLVSLVVKLALAAWLPLSTDEAYYWVWGHFPSWGYFDHPPMVGWLFWLGRVSEAFGGQSSRWPGVVLGHATFLVWRELIKQDLSDREASRWLVLLALSPLLGLGSLIVTPDVPLVFFWSLSILFLRRAIETPVPRRWAWTWYAGLGAALGLGFCSKYPIVLFVPAALGWLAASGEWRSVRWRLVPVTVASGLAFCFPVLWWNHLHQWASFRFQLEHGLGGGAFRIAWPLEYASAQVALLFPPLLWLALSGREPRSMRWLRWFAWTPLLFFFLSSFGASAEANWPIAGYPAALTLAFFNMRPRAGSMWWRIAVGTWALGLLVVFSQAAYPWIPLRPERLKTSEFVKFDALLPAIANAPDVFASTYQMASMLSYRTKRMIPKLAGMNRRDFFDFQDQSWPKGDTFLLAAELGEPLPARLGAEGYLVASTRLITPKLLLYEVVRRAKNRDR